jgi:hypothetical protein
VIRFYNNPTPLNGDVAYASPADPTDSTGTIAMQSYTELNNASTVRTVTVGNDGEWDFPLVVDASAPNSTSYCFRMVRSDGTTTGITYTVVPEVITGGVATLTQSSYRFYSNANATSTGSALAAQNVTSTAPAQGTPFRLKMLVLASGGTVSQSGRTLKLQLASLNGTCASSSYSDVATSTGVIRFYDNSTPSDGISISASGTDPTDGINTIIPETYEEQNNFTNSTAAIFAGQDGLWDFSLVDQGMTDGGTYCFRAVDSNGTVLDAYSWYPAITKGVPADASAAPTYTSVATSTLTVGWTSVSGATYYRLERSTNGNTFSEVATTTATSLAQTSLSSSTTYYYRYRAANSAGNGGYSASSSVTTQTGFTSGTLMSVIIDTAITNGVGPNSLFWEGSAPAATTVKFQFAASNATSGPWTASDFVAWNGLSCDSSSYYTPSGPSVPVEIKALCYNNKRYLRYKVFVSTANPSVTPTVDRIILNYAK